MDRAKNCLFLATAMLGATIPSAALSEEVGYQLISSYWADYNEGTAATGEAACGKCLKRSCDGGCLPKFCWLSGWHLQLDGMWLDRNSSASATLVRQTAPPNNVLLTSGDLSFEPDGGFRLSLLRDVACGYWEFSWLNGQWDSAARVSEIGNLDVVAGTADYTDADSVSVAYFSDLDSVELNRHWQTCREVSLLAGVRYMSLDEIFNLASTDGGQTSNYNIGTSNDLFGVQVGGRWSYCLLADVTFNLVGKAGVYYAERSQNVDFRDNNDTPTFVYRNENNGAAFVGELDANVTWQVWERFAVRGGFQYMWFQSVVLAPEQFQGSLAAIAARGIPNAGSFDMYGGYLGVELAW